MIGQSKMARVVAPGLLLVLLTALISGVSNFVNFWAVQGTSSDAFIGFAAANTTPGSSGSVIINGIVDGLSGLSVGKQYYLSNASGDISIAPGTVTRKVGIATSASTLLITNSW